MGTQLSALKNSHGEGAERTHFAATEAALAAVLNKEEKTRSEKHKGPSALQVCSRLVRRSIHEAYYVSCRVLGQGSGGSIYGARSKLTGRECCIKFFQKNARSLGVTAARNTRLKIRNEINVHLRVDHPNIVRLLEIYEDEKQLAVVIEYCSGGDLFSHLSTRGRFPEQHVRPLVHQMLLVLCYLHAHNVVHRDLRLEKWVFATDRSQAGCAPGAPVPVGALKLVDLGHAKLWSEKTRRMEAACGSLPYASPDVLVGGYTQACDLWSLGVMTYMLLCGHPPFHGRQQSLVSQILSGAYSTSTPGWEGVSDAARDFVERLMDVDSVRRMTAHEAFTHVWLASVKPPVDVPLPSDFLTSVKKFAVGSSVRRAILTTMAYSVTPEAAGGLDQLFFSWCKTPRGTIQLDEFMASMKSHFAFLDVPQIVEFFEALDSSHDGEISYNDFLAVMLSAELENDVHLLTHTFHKWDADRSGYISLDDLRVLLGDRYREDALEEMMQELDANGNGHIDLDEFIAAVCDDDFDSESRDDSSAYRAVGAGARRPILNISASAEKALVQYHRGRRRR
ncbi:calcium-dependent protein kinase CDPK4A [Besnoitia besnoiti]|uniref:Calcium-dependent protein kinase CDPK4A n=1 Tax=Besnoitia besnoiti TaxID=94643 RepID=A0A2A9M384_BESBE|nr:calcium-dependent protein kinase CDPK4A [Besnoitia besnoiti]PFH31684.1 calcium-dependent protein kinase CDPK4A [Besnoitia besnoiti]